MDFKQTIKQSFRNAKMDFDAIKVSFVDWINFLGNNQKIMQQHIDALESRVKELESEGRIIVKAY
jgi:hypothetical protein